MITLITGGASGLGEAITRRMAQDPKGTVYFTFNKSDGNAKKLEASFTNAHSIKCDFKEKSEVNTLVERIGEINPDLLINNAYNGTFIKFHFHKMPVDDFLTEFKDNIIPTIAITQSAILYFRKKKKGKIITILTSALNSPPIGASIYVANKAYLEKLVQVWAIENDKFNITSIAVSPSFMLTDFTKSIDERMVEQIKASHPLNKLLTPDEVAETVFSLADSAQTINGVNIALDLAKQSK